jgi:hypothetical protein
MQHYRAARSLLGYDPIIDFYICCISLVKSFTKYCYLFHYDTIVFYRIVEMAAIFSPVIKYFMKYIVAPMARNSDGI